ncbi:hypothetical protein ACMD2_24012 [Ananas comosus]|uniref:Uncharacterized protein n=1 Tax=Ananas comosus TaxID=4615 RepID=A0A199UWR0_ANACO|nr:hypothetical protein ACMD2_24012 [Ananas comosus]
MDSASLITPSSEERFWSKLRNRVEAILDDRRPANRPADPAAHLCGADRARKRSREDSLLLIRGLDSVASSLSQLSDTLSAAQQEVNALAKASVAAKELQGESQRTDEEEGPKAKRHCGSAEIPEKHDSAYTDKNKVIAHTDKNEAIDSDKHNENKEEAASDECQDKNDKHTSSDVLRSAKLKQAKNLAISMATKASSLTRELKTIKSELLFMQERCSLLEEENRRLREGIEKGVSEEDDLVRLQLEALLAEKSRLAQENANLLRENQSLHQLVEYHQLTSQDLSASYEQVMQGMCLDFSSPLGKIESDSDDSENGYEEDGVIEQIS